jgi:hypothetical protein
MPCQQLNHTISLYGVRFFSRVGRQQHGLSHGGKLIPIAYRGRVKLLCQRHAGLQRRSHTGIFALFVDPASLNWNRCAHCCSA